MGLTTAFRNGTRLLASLPRAAAAAFSARTERMRLNRERLELFNTFIEGQGAGAGLVDENEEFVFVNPNAEAMFGVGPGALVGRNLGDFSLPEEVELVRKQTAKRRSGEKGSYDFPIVRADGVRRIIRVFATPRANRKGEYAGAFGVFTDITERRKAEALKDAVYRISLAANDADDMQKLFFDIDMIVGTLLSAEVFTIALFDSVTGQIAYPYYRNTTTLTRMPTATEHSLIDLVLHRGESFLQTPVPAHQHDGAGGETTERPLDGNWLGVPLRAKEVTIGVIAVQNGGEAWYGEEEKNILEFVSTQIAMSINRKRAENKLRASEEKFSKIFSSNPDPVVLFSFGEGAVSEVNESFLYWTEYSRDELIGHTLLELGLFCNEEDRQAFRDIMQTEGVVRNRECWFRKKNGILALALISAEFVTMDGRVNLLSVVKDITDRKQSEDRIKTSLREKEVMLKEIHHRVKNNLQVISSLLRLQSRSVTDGQMLEILKESQNRVKSMAMIHEKLYLSDDLSHVDFGDYLRNLASSLIRTYGGGEIALDFHVAGIHLSIDTAIPCGLIVNELISNSLKYAFVKVDGPPGLGKCITVKLERLDDGDLLLVVADNGIGIPEDVDVASAKSLGMRLVGILTKQINGALTIDRRNGTYFSIRFALR